MLLKKISITQVIVKPKKPAQNACLLDFPRKNAARKEIKHADHQGKKKLLTSDVKKMINMIMESLC